jgi:hypothetical protein
MPPSKPAESWRMLCSCRGKQPGQPRALPQRPSTFGSANRQPIEGRAGEGRRVPQGRPQPMRRMGRMQRQQRQEAKTRRMPPCCELPGRFAAQLPRRELRDLQLSTAKEELFPARGRRLRKSRQPKALQSSHKSADSTGLRWQRLLTCHPKGVYLEIAVSPLQWRVHLCVR